jgi:hypothetical protein
VRGVVAPLAAFHAIQRLEIHTLGWIATALIIASSLLLLPEVKFGRFGRKGQPVVEEIPD